jgi:hypothetical protein
MRKRTCAECGNNRFGLIRHYSGFSQFCTRLCEERSNAGGLRGGTNQGFSPASLGLRNAGAIRDYNSAPPHPGRTLPRPAT